MSERERQSVLLREYFDRRRRVYDARLEKFLHLYPYNDTGKGAELCTFEFAVKSTDSLQKKAILQAFQQEKAYWNSTYVVNNCDSRIRTHIISTLAGMEKILGKIGNPHTNTTATGSQSVCTGNRLKIPAPLSVTPPAQTPVDANQWGRAGEEAVDYVLKWLPDMYCVIEKDCQGKYDDDVIVLENASFIDESQEFDHLVVGPQGIFNIETKNYAGKLTIDPNGNWFRLKKGETEWSAEENPAQQLFRHHMLLQSIVGDDVPIIDVICMAHPNVMISGQENSVIPVVKKDLLAAFIVNYQPAGLTAEDISMIADKIEACKVDQEQQ